MFTVKSFTHEANRQAITIGTSVKRNIYDMVTIYGTVQEDGRQSLYAEGNAIIDSIHVSVGEMVRAGDPLVTLSPVNEHTQSSVVYTDATTWAKQLYQSGSINDTQVKNEFQTVFNRFMISDNQVAIDRNQEAYTIYSPIEGMVVSISGKVGDGVTKFFPAVIVTDLKQLSIKADVSESVLRQISLNDSCSVSVPALGDYKYSGEIAYISPYAHETDLLSGGGTYVTEVIVSLNQTGVTLRPGYQATVKVTIGEQKNVMLIPYDSVAQDDNGREYVMVWTGKEAYRNDIITGKEVDDFVQVLSGLSENQNIIRHVNQINFTESVMLYEASR